MTDLIQNNKSLLRGKTAMVIAWLAMLLFALHASTHMVGAGDTWVALSCGRHFINHGVDTNEPFSANSHRAGPTPEEIKHWPNWAQKLTETVGLDTVKYWHPTGWINQNWLTHSIFYWLTHLSPFADDADWSFNSLVYWKFAIYILTVICVYYTARVLGVSPALSAVSACAAMFIGRSLLDIRPAGFSNLLVAAFLLTLVLATYRNHLYIWFIVPMTVFWANLHGGYIYVFIMLAPVVILHLLTILRKKATVTVHCILTWLVLYAAILKYTNHEPFSSVSPFQDKILILLFLFIVGSVVLALNKSIKAPAFYSYHIVVSLIVFLVLFIRLFPSSLRDYSPEALEYILNSRFSFFIAFAAAAALGIIVTLLKDRLVVTSPAAVWHTVAAGFVALVASIIFNPFHLTNLTHTFIISISQNAEGWRNVHEWWGAFRWDNPVGAALPFLVMLIMGGGLIALWLFGRLLMPKLLKGPKLELDRQQKRFNILRKILGFSAAVMVFWTAMMSVSLIESSFAGFLLSLLFVGILWGSVFVNVHFIYMTIVLATFALYTGEPTQGYNGRYIFSFIILPAYVLMFVFGSQLSDKPKYSMVNILYVLAAAIAAVILITVTENPFKFQQPVWHIGQFMGQKRIWQPLYEANLEASYPYQFPVIYFMNLLGILGWLTAAYIQRFKFTEQAVGTNQNETYRLPRIDLALVSIAVLTAYMAVRSRRFIPIAGYAACPVIAMFAGQLFEMAGAAMNFYKNGRFIVPCMPVRLQKFLIAAGGVIVLTLSLWWGYWFKSIYLDPWPSEKKLTSVFIRMTASAAKPFYACQFIRDNHLLGNMFNYWTEGGFIAWGQEPDPNSGRTPLQLFMDGRAQAAYNYDAYMTWSKIMFGGDIVEQARMRQQSLTADDYVKVGQWIDSMLKRYRVWVVLMPSNQFETPFVKGVEYARDWRLVFLDDKQKLYVDISTPEGLKIYNGIEDGSTKYPYEGQRNIMIGHNALLLGESPEKLTRGLECAIKAYQEDQSRIPLQMIQIYYERYPQLRVSIEQFWRNTLDDFVANEKKYLSENGYYNRIVGALMASDYLRPIAQRENKPELVEFYNKKKNEFIQVIPSIGNKKW